MTTEVKSFSEADKLLMENYESLRAAFQALDLEDEFVRVATSTIPPERASQLFELIYANREDLDPALAEIGAAIGGFASRHGFYGLGQDNRGFLMAETIRGNLKAGEKAPEVKDRFAPKKPIETPPAPEAPAEEPVS